MSHTQFRLCAAPLALLLVAGCDLLIPKVSSDMLEAELTKWLADHDLEASEVHCPDNQKLEKGNLLDCTCVVDGVEIPVRVEVTDPATGSVEWQPKYTTVRADDLEASITALPALAEHQLGIHCDKGVYVSVPDSEASCEVVDQTTQEQFIAHLVFQDGEGNYELKLEAKTP